MQQTDRLIFNVLVTYLRMVLTVGLGLATTRLLLGTLGPVDFGLFSVLGGGLALIMLVSSALAMSAQRHLAYEIGRGDADALREVFSTSVVIYLVLGVLIAALGLALRPVFLGGLTIPADRAAAAAWVYDLTLVNMVLSVFATPYLAVFMARQAMVQDAIFGLLISLFGLLAVLLTPHLLDDRLVGYAILITVARLLMMLLQAARGLMLFPETRFHPRHVQRHRVRELVGFAGWSFLGSMGWELRTQGGNLLLNLFFGPVINTSYAITGQATGYLMSFSGVISRAGGPAITSLSGGGHGRQFHDLALSVSKLTTVASSVVAVPLILYPREVLTLWLGVIPPYADSFIPLTFAWVMIALLTVGHDLAISATGDLGKAVRFSFWITASPVAIAAIGFSTTSVSPPFIALATLAASIGNAAFTLFYTGRIVGIPARTWFRSVLVPVTGSVAVGLLPAVALTAVLPRSLLAVGVVAAVYPLLLGVGVALCGLSADERRLLLSFLQKVRRRSGRPAGAA